MTNKEKNILLMTIISVMNDYIDEEEKGCGDPKSVMSAIQTLMIPFIEEIIYESDDNTEEDIKAFQSKTAKMFFDKMKGEMS